MEDKIKQMELTLKNILGRLTTFVDTEDWEHLDVATNELRDGFSILDDMKKEVNDDH